MQFIKQVRLWIEYKQRGNLGSRSRWITITKNRYDDDLDFTIYKGPHTEQTVKISIPKYKLAKLLEWMQE